MKTYQFTYSKGVIISIKELAKFISNTNDSNVTLESKEGIYYHGLVNGNTKEIAQANLLYYMKKYKEALRNGVVE